MLCGAHSLAVRTAAFRAPSAGTNVGATECRAPASEEMGVHHAQDLFGDRLDHRGRRGRAGGRDRVRRSAGCCTTCRREASSTRRSSRPGRPRSSVNSGSSSMASSVPASSRWLAIALLVDLVLRPRARRADLGGDHLRARRPAGDAGIRDHRPSLCRADPRRERARHRGRGGRYAALRVQASPAARSSRSRQSDGITV